jgi:hypothetical protein
MRKEDINQAEKRVLPPPPEPTPIIQVEVKETTSMT